MKDKLLSLFRAGKWWALISSALVYLTYNRMTIAGGGFAASGTDIGGLSAEEWGSIGVALYGAYKFVRENIGPGIATAQADSLLEQLHAIYFKAGDFGKCDVIEGLTGKSKQTDVIKVPARRREVNSVAWRK